MLFSFLFPFLSFISKVGNCSFCLLMISIFPRARLDLHLLSKFPEGVSLESECDRRSRRSRRRRRCAGIGSKEGRGPLSPSRTWPHPSPPHRFPLFSFPLTHQVQVNPLKHQNKGPSVWKWISKHKFGKNCNSISHWLQNSRIQY